MKILTPVLAALTASALALSPLALHAQDAPPPPMDQGGAPPAPQDQGGAPPPQDQDQSAPPPPDQSQGGGDDSGASFDQFYNGLSNEGQWIQTPDYGYVFQPDVTDPNWAPYTEGHWVYTDYGWTWASDEPWGWATYHYGRWANLDGTGWVWVPGYQWAPAWVSWRYGGGYCGWAPLPPSTFVGVEYGGDLGFDFHFGSDVDVAFGIGPAYYNFIPIGYIGDPSYHHWYVDRGRNFAIINGTRNITNIYVSRHPGAGAFSAVRTQGPALATVNAASHTPVQQVRLARMNQAGAGRVSNGTLSVFAPRINAATAHTARPATVASTLSTVRVNRGTNVSDPLQTNARFKPATPSESVVNAARAAQAHAPASVATASRIKPTARLSAPLTSMQTTAQQPRTANGGFTPNANTAVQHTPSYGANGATQQQHTYNPANGGYTPNANSSVQHQPTYQNQQNQQAEQQQQAAQAQERAQQQREDQARQQQAQAQQQHAQQQHDDEARQQQAQQERSQQQSQEQAQERAAAAQQEREQAVHQQQAQQQVQQQQHTFAQPQQQQHYSAPPVQQHVSAPQVQQHVSAPPAQSHPAPAAQGSTNGNKNQNGQNH